IGVERLLAELVRAVVELVLPFARLRLGRDLLAHGLERLHLAGAYLVEPDDVEAVVAAHGLADLPDLQREQRVLEGTDELAAREPGELAALRLRAGVGRDLGCDSGEILAASEPRDDTFGRRLRRVVLSFRNADQDVPRAPLLGRLEPSALFFVGLAQLLVGDLDGRSDVGQSELDVFEIDGLGRLVARLVVLVARCNRRVVDREQRVADFALLVVELDITAKLRRRQERRIDDAVLQVADLERLALLRLEPARRVTGVRELGAVAVQGKLTVDLERGGVANGLRDALVRGAVALGFDSLPDRGVLHQIFDDGAPQLAAHVFGELAAIDLLILILAVLQRAIEIEDRDLLAVDSRGEIRVAGQREIASVDAPENERDGDQAEDDHD